MRHLVSLIWHFLGRQNDLILSSPDTPVTALVFLDSGATGFTTDSSAPVSSMKSMFWSPAFKVTVGSRGPDISEPWQPYLISKPASPTTAGASSSFLALGYLFKLGTRHTGLAVMGPGASVGTG